MLKPHDLLLDTRYFTPRDLRILNRARARSLAGVPPYSQRGTDDTSVRLNPRPGGPPRNVYRLKHGLREHLDDHGRHSPGAGKPLLELADKMDALRTVLDLV